MTLNEFTTEIAGKYGKQLDLQYRQWLVPHINHWRSRLIRNSLQKNPNERSQFLQKIEIPLTYGNYICAGFSCTASYSEAIPKLLRIGDTPFEYLGPADGSSPFRYNDIGTAHYINAGMTAHLFLYYEMENDKVLIKNQRIARVSGAGIFDEPEKAMEWQCKTQSSGCDWWNEQYPVTGDIANDIKTGLWSQLDERGEIKPAHKDQDE